ncbi:hypothetical protein SH601_06430 [Gracilibacillus sp. S3-1-1]|uniref:Uncharacterized protein n=1 Tax=Gracilibacillus pellucidus TaxID=3095368 RepID=A0ACC6M3T3_9BACI|nr:DUF2975 domain-containing protein [Gracilibacillus sp. S3-1-1]MDX8045621.1 hypothetical protein [Gracilibacillus sp. S3-1-1]
MTIKHLFKAVYLLCRLLFIIVIPIALFAILYHVAILFFPTSSFAKSFDNFEPIISWVDIQFDQQPDLYLNTDIQLYSFISTVAACSLCLSVLRLCDKLFKNIYQDSLFTYKNVKIFYTLGIIILSLGTIFTYVDGLLFDKTIEILNVVNATISFSNISYMDALFTGIACLLIGAALKVAVKAVEENKYTI